MEISERSILAVLASVNKNHLDYIPEGPAKDSHNFSGNISKLDLDKSNSLSVSITHLKLLTILTNILGFSFGQLLNIICIRKKSIQFCQALKFRIKVGIKS